MQILLTNDDGIFAPGLRALHKELSKLGDVAVAAPADVQSAMSHSISLSPVIVNEVDVHGAFTGYSVQGSPADCVKIAVMELLDNVDLIVSGINHGANVGVNICYSGTVAAAMEGAFFDIPSVAISAALEDEMNFREAVKLGVGVMKSLLPLKGGDVININIPQLGKFKEPKGVKVLPQSIRGFEEKFRKTTNSAGQTVFQIYGGGHKLEEIDTDTTSLMEGYITVTALHYDMTEYKRNRELEEKLKSCSKKY